MKTILSIPLIILILFTGVSVKFATHYCGGYVAATKVSLTGELATCGMESGSESKTLQQTLGNHCCDNTLSAYSICNNYFASSFNIEVPGQLVTNLLLSPYGYLSNYETNFNTSLSEIKPPGIYNPNSVDRPVLCIFRI
jgi:hypothetical protein